MGISKRGIALKQAGMLTVGAVLLGIQFGWMLGLTVWCLGWAVQPMIS